LLFRARAFIALPGGFGTLDEVLGEVDEAFDLVPTRPIAPLPIGLVGRDSWTKAIDLAHLAVHGFFEATDASPVHVADSGAEAAAHVLAHCGCTGAPAG
jgi:predicted Rossmann-fold nucleotide-binding protein